MSDAPDAGDAARQATDQPRTPHQPKEVGVLERIRQGTLLADGAMGTMLYSLGVPFDRCFDALSVSEPELVRRVHNDYIAAGAELIETNTFGANALRLAEHGFEDRVAEINRAGAELARQAADAAEDTVYVAGSIGPLGVTLAPVGSLSPERARAAFEGQARSLAEGGVDLLLIETLQDLSEALLALEAAKAVTDLPVAVMLTFGEDNLTPSGASPEEVARALETGGADIIGANCSLGPSQILDVAADLVANTSLPVCAMPNAGLPTVVGGRYMYTSSPAYMGEVATQMEAVGVRIIGGCCGTTPDHIAAIKAALAAGGSTSPRLSFPTSEPIRARSRESLQRPTRLQQALQERFVVSVEVDPPNGFDVGHVLPKLRMLRDSGYVDAFDVADSPRAQARMSALALAALIAGELGTETVLHMACRHRNLVAVHSELLGAHALNIRNIFVVMGDLPALGDYPDATAVNDITATGLMALLSNFNRGIDPNGRALDDSTAFHIGCAFNFNAPDLDRELALFDKKLASGASFALTQPVYEPAAVERVLDRFNGRMPIPVILGVLPLWNARHAAFLHNEVPGIVIPEATMRRMEAAGESGRDAGVAVSQEILTALGGAVQGAYFMPPFGRYELVAEVMSGVLAAGARVPA